MTAEPSETRLPLGNVAFLTGASIVQMLVQFVLLTLIARWFGTSVEVDAFNAAFAVPLAISAVLVAPLPLVLVPEMVRFLAEDAGRPRAWRLAGSVLVFFSAVGLLLALGIHLYPRLVAEWLFGFASDEVGLAGRFLKRLGWLIPLNGGITLLQAIHHAQRSFRLPALSNLIGVSVPVLWIVPLSQPTLMDIVNGIVAGGVIAVAVLLAPTSRGLLSGVVGGILGGRRSTDPWIVDVWRFSWLVAPLVVAGIYARIDPLVDRMIASHLDPGGIAELGYAHRLVMALATLVSSGLSVAIFPQLAAGGSAKGGLAHAGLLALAWRFLIFLLIPCVTAVFLFGPAIVADLFERGAFGPEATRHVSLLLSLLMGVLVGGSIGEIASKSLFARGRTRGPALVAVIGFTIGVFLKIGLSQPFGVAGVAAGTAIYYLINVSLFLWMIYRDLGSDAFRGLRKTSLQALMASAAAAAAGAVPVMLLAQGGAVVGACVGLLVYVGVQVALRSEFVPSQWNWRSVRQGRGDP